MSRGHWAVCVAMLVASATLLAQGGTSQLNSTVRSISATLQDRGALRTWDAAVDRLVRDGELVVRKVRTDTMIEGRSHERYDQYFQGVRVFGGDIARQVADGATESIFGTLHTVTGLQTRPKLSADGARDAFEKLSGGPLPENREIELVILPKDDGGYALTYRTHVWRERRWMHTFLDANSGEVVLEYNDLKKQTAAVGTGTGVLGDQKKISTTSTSGRFTADDSLRPPTLDYVRHAGESCAESRPILRRSYQPTASTSPAIPTTCGRTSRTRRARSSRWTYDYYYKRFGRRGLDDNDTPILAITHPVSRNRSLAMPHSRYNLNAFWCGGCGPSAEEPWSSVTDCRRTSLSGPDRRLLLPARLDIVAHELTHGLTDYSSTLISRNESGALNEAFSDMLGTSVRICLSDSRLRSAAGGLPDRRGRLSRRAVYDRCRIRARFGDPDHYSRRLITTEDNGGVHSNSGIPNQAFYLAIEGGTNRTSNLSVQGVGAANRQQIERVFYRAFVFMLPSNATFSTARAATIQAARELYPGSNVESAVTQAWTAVGVQ